MTLRMCMSQMLVAVALTVVTIYSPQQLSAQERDWDVRLDPNIKVDSVAQDSGWVRRPDSLDSPGEWDVRPDSVLSKLSYPSRFGKISVLDCWRDSVSNWLGHGYYSEEGGHGGTSYFTDPRKLVVLRVEWGVDWHVDEISFSYGAAEDLPDEFKFIRELPDTAISSHLRPDLALDGRIRLGSSPQRILRLLGKPAIDSVAQKFRYLSYNTDYRTTKDVLAYEVWFYFKDNHLIRFTVYNGE